MIRLIFRTEIIFLIGVMQLELLQETKKMEFEDVSRLLFSTIFSDAYQL